MVAGMRLGEAKGNVVIDDLHYQASKYMYRMLERDGRIELRIVPYRENDGYWAVPPEDMERAIDKNTRLVSLAWSQTSTDICTTYAGLPKPLTITVRMFMPTLSKPPVPLRSTCARWVSTSRPAVRTSGSWVTSVLAFSMSAKNCRTGS